MVTIDQVQLLDLLDRSDSRGTLVIAEARRQVPFAIERVFAISGVDRDVARGGHAHISLKQFFVCLSGSVHMRYCDGQREGSTVLNSPRQGLFVPPLIWADQIYLDPQTVLLVLCDAAYDEDDYIRDYDAFLHYRSTQPDGARQIEPKGSPRV